MKTSRVTERGLSTKVPKTAIVLGRKIDRRNDKGAQRVDSR